MSDTEPSARPSTKGAVNFRRIPRSEKRDELFRCILICNDAIIIEDKLSCNSQDEQVLLDTLQDKYGCKLVSRTTDSVEIEINEEVETWKIIKLNEFSSDRKMMSIVVRREEDDLLMSYVKGADMAVYMQVLNNQGASE